MNLKNNVSQWGGGAFMIGSLFFLVNKIDEMSRLFLGRRMADVISERDTLLIVIGQGAFILGFVGLWQLFSPRVNRSGRLAVGFISGGGIILAVGHFAFISALGELLPRNVAANLEYLFALVLLGLLLLVSGLIWFGVQNIRRPVMARWPWLPLFTGLMGFIGFFIFSGEEITAFFLFFRTLFALGLLGMGLGMWLERSWQLQVA